MSWRHLPLQGVSVPPWSLQWHDRGVQPPVTGEDVFGTDRVKDEKLQERKFSIKKQTPNQ